MLFRPISTPQRRHQIVKIFRGLDTPKNGAA
jgi:hypothetical protein